MHPKPNKIISASTVSMLAFTALFQTPIRVEANDANVSRAQQYEAVESYPVAAKIDDRRTKIRPAGRLHDVAKASDLTGMTVKNYQDEKIGKVEDFAVDVESGRVVQVILSTSGKD